MKGKLFAGLLAGGIGLLPSNISAQGLMFNGAGGMNLSMAGASTATGVDALGSLYWNPAAISLLGGSEVVIGGAMILPSTHVSSTIPAGAFGPFGPLGTLTGRTRSDSGLGMASNIGLVYKPEGSSWTTGIGLLTLAAGGVNFPGDPANPILAPVGPFNRFVLGPQAGSLTVLAITPTASYQITDRLAVGGGPMIDVSLISFDPAFFGPPTDDNADGLKSFPNGSHTRPYWGGGFRLGTTYRMTDALTAGFSFTSPQWFETWQFNAANEVGQPISFTTQFSLPTILSAGLAYTGIDKLLLASDLRWMDYGTTKLLGQSIQDGGAGWRSIWALATGAKYQLTEKYSVQAGYLFNENPIPTNLALFNSMLPCITQHTMSVGSSMQINDSIGLSLSWVHGFKNTLTGSVVQLTGTSTTLETQYDALAFGLHVKFGASCSKPRECTECASSAVPAAAPPTTPSAGNPG